MAYDLSLLTRTPDLRTAPLGHARLVCALRYCHMARAAGCYSDEGLARHLGSPDAVRGFQAFLDEAGHAWPEPIVLNPPCQARFSLDEALLAELCAAAGRGDRAAFDALLRDMAGEAARRAIWLAARRLMRALAPVAG